MSQSDVKKQLDVPIPLEDINEKDGSTTSAVLIEDVQIGVRKFRVARPRRAVTDIFNSIFSIGPYVAQSLLMLSRLGKDILQVSPHYASVFLTWKLWFSVNDTMEMYLSNQLLQMVEVYITTRQIHVGWMLTFGTARVLLTGLSSFIEWHGNRADRIVETRVTRHFELLIAKGDISRDLASAAEHRYRRDARGYKAFDSFESIIRFVSRIIQAMTQLALVITVSKNTGRISFVILCLLHPLCGFFWKKTLQHAECITFVDDPHHLRLQAFNRFVSGYFRQDILSNGLDKWIISQMLHLTQLLGDKLDRPVWRLLHMDDSFENSPIPEIVIAILGELPMAYCIVNAILYPQSLSIASLSLLRSSTQTLHYSVSSLLSQAEMFSRCLADVRGIYIAGEAGKNAMDQGTTPYPNAAFSGNPQSSRGMAFELRNVSFSYPGVQTRKALDSISLKIEPGSLVVFVGANGSGKSTLVRLLSRLYEPLSGSGAFLIDGLPASEYRIGDLYRAIALLSQENCVYPLSLADNISLGAGETGSDMEQITEAARLGGAEEFIISRQEKGFNTELETFIDASSHNLQGKPDSHPLLKELKALPKDIDLSGGEKQRLVASRTFMRFTTGGVRFVAVDEPTSALDAEGELQLFNNLIAAREGKTMVFVTHRFGHLTKHADKIVCMKDGHIVEVGTHAELIQKVDGEYANLYNIQARAFSN